MRLGGAFLKGYELEWFEGIGLTMGPSLKMCLQWN